MIKDLPRQVHKNLLIGIDTRDDAGIYKLSDELALIQTLDFFTPMVDDPYIFGQIAATNALNDVYAMGGRPLLAMNIVCYPECEDPGVLHQILKGGLNKLQEAGALLVGGHTVDDLEPKYGLAVAGLVHPGKVITNAGARPGDRIFLTKPLGTGIISTAIKAGMASQNAYQEAVDWMTRLNWELPDIAELIPVNAATDVTGFGLAGHLVEMATASNVAIELYLDQIPCIKPGLEYATWGLIPAGSYSNRDYLQGKIQFPGNASNPLMDLIFAPETAGGLLLSVSEPHWAEINEVMAAHNSTVHPIGQVLESGFKPIRLR